MTRTNLTRYHLTAGRWRHEARSLADISACYRQLHAEHGEHLPVGLVYADDERLGEIRPTGVIWANGKIVFDPDLGAAKAERLAELRGQIDHHESEAARLKRRYADLDGPPVQLDAA